MATLLGLGRELVPNGLTELRNKMDMHVPKVCLLLDRCSLFTDRKETPQFYGDTGYRIFQEVYQ